MDPMAEMGRVGPTTWGGQARPTT